METTTDYMFDCPVPIGLAIGIIILALLLFLLNCLRGGADLCSCFSCLLNELLLGGFLLIGCFPLNTTKKPFLRSDTFSRTAEPPPPPPPVSKARGFDRPKDMKLTRREVEIVMDRLGMFPGGEQLAFEEEEKIDMVGCEEMSCVFDEQEPSLGEVKEAFDVFDRNGDGYIDAAELRRVLCALGVKEVSERECRRQLRAYARDNIDGRIYFKDFIKLVEKSFSIPE